MLYVTRPCASLYQGPSSYDPDGTQESYYSCAWNSGRQMEDFLDSCESPPLPQHKDEGPGCNKATAGEAEKRFCRHIRSAGYPLSVPKSEASGSHPDVVWITVGPLVASSSSH